MGIHLGLPAELAKVKKVLRAACVTWENTMCICIWIGGDGGCTRNTGQPIDGDDPSLAYCGAVMVGVTSDWTCMGGRADSQLSSAAARALCPLTGQSPLAVGRHYCSSSPPLTHFHHPSINHTSYGGGR